MCKFYTFKYEGDTYLCIKCPEQKQEMDLEQAMKIVQENGFKIVKDAD